MQHKLNDAGEIVAWSSCDGKKVALADVRQALRDSGLDEKLARNRLNRHALARAQRDLAEDRIIRTVEDTSAELTFQLNVEQRVGDHLEFPREAILTLDKKSGRISCANRPDLADTVQKLLDAHAGAWNASDVTRLVQKIFEGRSGRPRKGRRAHVDPGVDLFPLRPSGGAYFAPAASRPTIDKVEAFLDRVGGHLVRFEISAAEANARGLAKIVTAGLQASVSELDGLVEEIESSSHESTYADRSDRVDTLKLKLEAYAEFLGDRQEDLRKALGRAEAKLKAKRRNLVEAAI